MNKYFIKNNLVTVSFIKYNSLWKCYYDFITDKILWLDKENLKTNNYILSEGDKIKSENKIKNWINNNKFCFVSLN